MPRVTWPLNQGEPTVQIILTTTLDGRQTQRTLLADTGAGTMRSAFEVILDEDDCLIYGTAPMGTANLRGAYTGSFPLYGVRVQVPQLGFDAEIEVVGVSRSPTGLDGLAGFRFLNRFTYGNFGDKGQFGLER